ncbi:MAG TPA: adenylate/guanylate cyclase domain-containing protein [Acetobacteraceae bacterium]|nr:adenylate/guanylate cyclase domain-containing protein [Acetobacteraceae bacterium]
MSPEPLAAIIAGKGRSVFRRHTSRGQTQGMRSTASSVRRLRRTAPSGIRSVRLCSGLVLFTYVTLHLSNHALGNVSLDWMERGLLVQKFVWQGVIGTAALYCALAVHFVLGLWALYARRRLYWTLPELAQLLLGLSVPPLLANHLAVTRIAFTTFDLNKGYAQELYSFWITSPFLGGVQLTLLLVAWTHGCLGLHFWLRLKSWYGSAKSWLLVAAVLLPVLAVFGYFQAGREVMALARDPVWRAAATRSSIVGTAPQNTMLADLRDGFLLFDGIALGVIVLARIMRGLHDRRGGRICVAYPDGSRSVVPLGFSVLEASRLVGIALASPCNGRGRCSLCRVRVLANAPLPAAKEPEQRILDRLGLDAAAVRLACQLYPTSDVAVIPLIPPEAATAFLHRWQEGHAPEERFLVHMFIDMRDSTRLASTRLPHDSVFILGRFVAGVSAAVLEVGGQPNQFLGDGILAIFGLKVDATTACAQAIAALAVVARNVDQLRTLLREGLDARLMIGIGMQCGTTLVGEIGFRDHVTFTGLGDPPNVASRLQELSKEIGCEAVVTEDVLRIAGISGEALPFHSARLRGRDEDVPTRLFFAIEQDVRKLVPVTGGDRVGTPTV